MANPKRRHSNTRTRLRRANDFLIAPSLTTCPNCKTPILPHRVCPSCGTYKGRQVFTMKSEEKAKE